jgi:hypothetical protein
MPWCFTLKSFQGCIFRDIEVGSNHAHLQEILFEYRSCLPGLQFGYGDNLRTATTCERGRSCHPDVAYSLNDAVRGDKPTLIILLNKSYRDSMWLTTLATMHSKKRSGLYFDTDTQKHRDQCISYAINEIDPKCFSHEYTFSFFLCITISIFYKRKAEDAIKFTRRSGYVLSQTWFASGSHRLLETPIYY